jgi:hypothetical protein
MRRLHAGLTPYDLPFAENHKCGDALYAQLLGNSGVLVNIDLYNGSFFSYLPATSFRIGPIAIQGPHQVAKKSTRTGLSPLMSSEKDTFFFM